MTKVNSQFEEFLSAIGRESDRGCVICAAAYIDDAMESAIRSHLNALGNPPKSILDALLTRRPQPPIGSLSVRTNLARALGLIDDSLMTAIDGLRSMRNDAAHLGSPFSFDTYRLEKMYGALSDKEQAKLEEMDALRVGNPEKYSKRLVFETVMTSVFFRLVLMADDPVFWKTIMKVPGADVRRIAPGDDPQDSMKYFTDATPITPEWLESIGFKRVTRQPQSPKTSFDEHAADEAAAQQSHAEPVAAPDAPQSRAAGEL